MLTMSTMKYPNIAGGSNMAVNGNGGHVDDVDSLFSSSCWQNSTSVPSDFMDTQKLILDSSIHSLGSDKILLDGSLSQDNEITTKTTMDVLDNLLNPNLHELKPLPPFAGYTGHLSINGIQGHHYHALAHRLSEENNNNYSSFHEQNSLVSSSTCNLSTDSVEESDSKQMFGVDEVKVGYTDCVNPDSVSGSKLYNECNQPNNVTQVKTEMSEYDIASIDISTLIGTAIADTKVVNNTHEGEDASGSRDSWMDLDAWFEEECNDQQKSIIISHEGLSEFSMQHSPQNSVEFSKPSLEYTKNNSSQGNSTLQTLLTHGYMPLLQNRLQNGPPIKQEISNNTTNYGIESSTSSPPAVVSTTDNLILSVNGRFMHHYNIHGLGDDRIGSPDILGQNYPHTTTTTPNSTKKSRSRSQKKQQIASSTVFQTEQNLGLLGKEKPVHRCTICNRGFLNKSNIKVHLRTHTGEKPFRCETCAKAFRQKAHLLKHQQIHKRIGRD